MRDEETGETVCCPFCDSENECPHLVTIIDATNLECFGGQGDLLEACSDLVRESLQKRLANGLRKSPWKDSELREIWDYARSQYREQENYIDVDCDILLRLLGDLLSENGAEEPALSIEPDGADSPGSSSVLRPFYAENPKKVVAAVLADLRSRLGD